MEKVIVRRFVNQIETELFHYSNLKSNRTFQYYRHIVCGYKRIGENDYRIHFGFFTKSRQPLRRALAIIKKLNIPTEAVHFERIFQKRLKPGFLCSFNVGSSIGARPGRIGTIGLFSENEAGEKGLITCGHVISKKGGKGSGVYAPYAKRRWSTDKTMKIGEVEELIQPKSNYRNEIDAAFVTMEKDMVYQTSNILTIDRFKGRKLKVYPFDEEIADDAVIYKIGAKSLLKYGINGGIVKNVYIQNRYQFDEVILINETNQYLAFGGDSGGPAFIEKNNELFCIGIVMARQYVKVEGTRQGQMQVLVCPIQKILKMLKLKPL